MNAYDRTGNLIGRSLASWATASSVRRRLRLAATRSGASLRLEVLLRLHALLRRRRLGGQVLLDARLQVLRLFGHLARVGFFGFCGEVCVEARAFRQQSKDDQTKRSKESDGVQRRTGRGETTKRKALVSLRRGSGQLID